MLESLRVQGLSVRVLGFRPSCAVQELKEQKARAFSFARMSAFSLLGRPVRTSAWTAKFRIGRNGTPAA